jgi:hypothetical protein
MCCRKLITVLLYFLSSSAEAYDDTTRQSISLGFDRAFTTYFFREEGFGREIRSGVFQPGYIVEINFRGKDPLGFSTGIGHISRDFYVKYPESNDTHRQIGVRHGSYLWVYPFYFNYRVMHDRNWRYFLRAGIVFTRLNDDIYKEYTYEAYPAYAAKERYDWIKLSLLSWSLGAVVERNLLKQDIYLTSKISYTRELFNYRTGSTNSSNRLSLSLGINLMMSNILYKDRVSTLKKYPVGKS